MTTQNDKALHEARAWNWKSWPDEQGRWQTFSKKRGPKHAYTGPSKRTKAKRAAKKARGKR